MLVVVERVVFQATRDDRRSDQVRRHVGRALGLLTVAGIASILPSARANLPASAITSLTIPIYAIYMTSDPTCQTGLVATVPLVANPTPTNMAASPELGTGPIPDGGVSCVVIVANDNLSLAWAPGTYTSQSHFGTSTFEDSNCNAGGSEGPLHLCQQDKTNTEPTWPKQVKDDLDAAGLSSKLCANGTGEIVPLFLSSYSKCVGEVTADNSIGGGCEWSLNTSVTPEGYRSNSIWAAPTAAGDTKHGAHIDALPSTVTKFKFLIDPTPTVGGNGGTSCGGLGPPRFAFQAL